MQQAAAQETQAEAAGGSMAGHNSIARPTNIGNLQAAMQLEDPRKYCCYVRTSRITLALMLVRSIRRFIPSWHGWLEVEAS